MEIFDPAMSSVEKQIASTIRVQEVISQNIANANTPGYAAKEFNEVLNKAVERQDSRAVNLEQEMADMAKNSSKFSTYTKFLAAKLGVLRNVISQGRK